MIVGIQMKFHNQNRDIQRDTFETIYRSFFQSIETIDKMLVRISINDLNDKMSYQQAYLNVCCLSCIFVMAVFFGVFSSNSRSTIALANCRSISFIAIDSSSFLFSKLHWFFSPNDKIVDRFRAPNSRRRKQRWRMPRRCWISWI